MKRKLIHTGLSLLAGTAALFCAAVPLQAADKKPNILFIMGDDIGIMNVAAYHRGLMVGETPNIDRIAKEGTLFMTAYAEQSCTAGRTSFITGMNPLRAGMIMPQLPGSTSSLLPGTPALAIVSARSRIQHRRIRQEPPRRQDKLAADGARLSGVLGLPVSPRRDAGRELSRHQQVTDGASLWCRRARTRRSKALPRFRARLIPKTASA